MSRNRETKNLVVGLDIGTSKIVAIVGEVKPDGALEVIGMGMHESSGLKKGMVVNIEATVGAIQRALEEAELMADCKITEVHTGIAGSHIRSVNSSGMVKIKEKEVTQADVDRVLETASSISLPADQQKLHVLECKHGHDDFNKYILLEGASSARRKVLEGLEDSWAGFLIINYPKLQVIVKCHWKKWGS